MDIRRDMTVTRRKIKVLKTKMDKHLTQLSEVREVKGVQDECPSREYSLKEAGRLLS